MKQAIGELNGTLMVVIAIAALAAIFFTVIWPMIRTNMQNDATCSDAVCDIGVSVGEHNGMVFCHNPNDKDKVIYCPYRG
jgi:hypothetical protein